MHTRLNVLWSYLASNKASINVSCKTFGQVYEGQYTTTGHYFLFLNIISQSQNLIDFNLSP